MARDRKIEPAAAPPPEQTIFTGPETPAAFTAAAKNMSGEELAAVELLESSGWKVFLEVQIGDVREKNGRRRRTFRNQGRYPLALVLPGNGK